MKIRDDSPAADGPDATRPKLGRPTTAEQRRRRIAKLRESIADADIELVESALSIAKDPAASPSVRVQAIQAVGQFKARIEPSLPVDDDRAAARASLRRLLEIGLVGRFLETDSDKERIRVYRTLTLSEAAAEFNRQADLAITARDRLRQAVLEREKVRAYLESAELRGLGPQVKIEDPPPSIEATHPGLIVLNPRPEPSPPITAANAVQNERGEFPPMPLSEIAKLLDAGRLPSNNANRWAPPEY